jgi:hypothetical protein
MTIRASKADVIAIVEWQDGTNGPVIPLEPFIKQANIMVNWLDSQDTDNELDDDTLEAIEVQLAAHFYSVQRDPQYQSKSSATASGSFQGATGYSLQATHFGQNAMLLDVTSLLTKRNLEAQSGKRVSRTTWLGWQDHSEDPYD